MRFSGSLLVFSLLFLNVAVAAVPPAPTPLAPSNGASVVIPLTISWSAVTDPSGILGYNWQVSPSSTFTNVVLQNSTNGLTQDTVSGLPNGTYFWRVQVVSGAFVQGAWSQPQSFTVTGPGPTEPGTPTLSPTKAYSTFHPFESITFNWTAVPGATTYVLQASTDSTFPITTRIQFDNIPNNTFSFEIGNPEGNYFARVYAVTNGIAGVPSNVITFSVFFNNPIGPPPAPVSPPNGTALTLPVTLTWADVPNPQPSGYEVQIAKNSTFATIEEDDPQLNGPSRTVLSLTPGAKFWRVRSAQGDNSPTTAAETAWSATGTFTIISAPPTPVSVTLANSQLFSGDTTWVMVQLTSAVGGTATNISLTSSNPTAVPVPATITMPANTAWTQFMLPQTGQVTSPTPVVITATLNSASASAQFTLMPPSLKSLSITPATISGGAQAGAIVMLNGQAPAGGAPVSLASNSPAVRPPSFAIVPPGSSSVSIGIPTNTVTTNTPATVTANWNGVNVQSPVTLTPQQPPASLTLSPATVVGQSGSSFATVTIASPATSDDILQVTVSNPAIATQVPGSVVIPAGSTTGGFSISTAPVTVQTPVTISVSGGGVTKSAVLTVNPVAPPPPPATLSSLTVSPASVTGGAGAQGTVTLTSPAPSTGLTVTLSANLAAAHVPVSVKVASGATSATFAITTSAVTASTPVTISASAGSVTTTAPLTVTPAQTATLTVTATGKTGNSVTSSPAGINVAVGSSMSAPLPAGTVTLTVSGGRSAVWSGACSSGGSKTKTCTFTLSGNASVTASVQ